MRNLKPSRRLEHNMSYPSRRNREPMVATNHYQQRGDGSEERHLSRAILDHLCRIEGRQQEQSSQLHQILEQKKRDTELILNLRSSINNLTATQMEMKDEIQYLREIVGSRSVTERWHDPYQRREEPGPGVMPHYRRAYYGSHYQQPLLEDNRKPPPGPTSRPMDSSSDDEESRSSDGSTNWRAGNRSNPKRQRVDSDDNSPVRHRPSIQDDAPPPTSTDAEIDSFMEQRKIDGEWPVKLKRLMKFSTELDLIKLRFHRSEKYPHSIVAIPHNKQHKCIFCLMNQKYPVGTHSTRWMCSTCEVPLCRDFRQGSQTHFELWHSAKDLESEREKWLDSVRKKTHNPQSLLKNEGMDEAELLSPNPFSHAGPTYNNGYASGQENAIARLSRARPYSALQEMHRQKMQEKETTLAEFKSTDEEVDAFIQHRKDTARWPLTKNTVVYFSNDFDLIKIRFHQSEKHRHTPMKMPSQRSCRFCYHSTKKTKKSTFFICSTCEVPLCHDAYKREGVVSHFELWHSVQDLMTERDKVVDEMNGT